MDEKTNESTACVRPSNGPNSARFPNTVVVTHEGRRALFYDDLLRGKVSLVHFFATADAAALAFVGNLAKAQNYLAGRLGVDIFFYSITTDPSHDTPAVLEQFAAKIGAQPGWLFLTGEPNALGALRSRIFVSGPAHHHDSAAEDCALGMFRYGNEAAGLWGSAPLVSPPEWIAERLSWMVPRAANSGGVFRRRGPTLLRAGLAGGGEK